jgi:hypothetical protein
MDKLFTSAMLSPRQAREMLGVSRSEFDKIKLELRPVQYSPNGKSYYIRREIVAYLQAHPKGAAPKP